LTTPNKHLYPAAEIMTGVWVNKEISVGERTIEDAGAWKRNES